MRAAIIGTSFISEIHFRELSKKKFDEIFIISRNKTKSRIFIEKNKKNYKGKLLIGNKNILKNLKFDFVSLCSNTKIHYKYLLFLKKVKSFIFVEKPLFSITQYNNINISKKLNNIFTNNRKIATSYPMKYLANSFINKFKFKKKIKCIEIFYQTRGQNQYNDIADDLLPHSLSLFFLLCEKTKTEAGLLLNCKIIKKKHSWSGKVFFKNLLCKINFKENHKNSKSIFYFKINNEKIMRQTKTLKGEFINYLIFNRIEKKIQNPMITCINDAVKNHKNLKWINNQKIFTKKIVMLSSKLLDN